MERLDNIKYRNIEMINRTYAGNNLKGFDFIHRSGNGKDDEVLATIYCKDLKLATAVDNALRSIFKDTEDNKK